MGSYAVYVVGRGKTGRLGTGDFKKRRIPFCIPSLRGADIKSFSLSNSHAGAVIGNEVWMWGEGEYGALGRGVVGRQAVPWRLVSPRQVRQVAVADNHTLALVEPALVYAWGRNDVGQLGSGNNTLGSPVPLLVAVLQDISILAVHARDSVSAAISSEGDLYTWGSGPLGTGMRSSPSPSAVKVNDEKWKMVAFGVGHGAAVTNEGRVYVWAAWGASDPRPLRPLFSSSFSPSSPFSSSFPSSSPTFSSSPFSSSAFSSNEILTPVQVSVAPPGVKLIEIAAGDYHTAAIGDDGKVYAWGANSEGQIGIGTCDLEQSPTIVGGLLSMRWALKVACGAAHTLVLTAEGEVYSFGNGDKYQLGLCDKKGRLLPEQLTLPGAAIIVCASSDASAIVVVDNLSNTSKRGPRKLSQSDKKVVPSNMSATGGSLSSKLSTSLGNIPKVYMDSVEMKRALALRTPPRPQKAETVLKKFSVVVTSWNCNNRRREGGLGDWLLEAGFVSEQESMPDIMAIGVQEVVKMRTDSVVMATASQRKNHHASDAGLHLPWQQDIDRVLIPKGYERIGSKILVGVYLAIYIKQDLVPHMSGLQAVVVPCGVMGKIGNKGAVAIRFTIFNKGFCFICSHIAAGSSYEAVERRNQDWRTISSKIHFSQGLTIFDHENLFWFGDLNYRIDMNRAMVLNYIDTQSWSVLQRSDQLNLERLAGRTFLGFQESPLNFEPTYKYDPGTTIHDTSEKNRTPAWCDRILYRGEDIEQTSYRRHEILDSDHRPISGAFYVVMDVPAPTITPRTPISALSMHRPPSTPPFFPNSSSPPSSTSSTPPSPSSLSSSPFQPALIFSTSSPSPPCIIASHPLPIIAPRPLPVIPQDAQKMSLRPKSLPRPIKSLPPTPTRPSNDHAFMPISVPTSERNASPSGHRSVAFSEPPIRVDADSDSRRSLSVYIPNHESLDIISNNGPFSIANSASNSFLERISETEIKIGDDSHEHLNSLVSTASSKPTQQTEVEGARKSQSMLALELNQFIHSTEKAKPTELTELNLPKSTQLTESTDSISEIEFTDLNSLPTNINTTSTPPTEFVELGHIEAKTELSDSNLQLTDHSQTTPTTIDPSKSLLTEPLTELPAESLTELPSLTESVVNATNTTYKGTSLSVSLASLPSLPSLPRSESEGRVDAKEWAQRGSAQARRTIQIGSGGLKHLLDEINNNTNSNINNNKDDNNHKDNNNNKDTNNNKDNNNENNNNNNNTDININSNDDDNNNNNNNNINDNINDSINNNINNNINDNINNTLTSSTENTTTVENAPPSDPPTGAKQNFLTTTSSSTRRPRQATIFAQHRSSPDTLQ